MIANPQTTREERMAVIRQIVAERLFHKPEEVTLQSRLIADLGADSLDFVDLQFLIEKRFGIELGRGDMMLGLQERLIRKRCRSANC